MDIWIAVALVAVLALMTQPWFWLLAFFIGGLASLFALLASIAHFQIIGAIGFFFLMAFCFACLVGVANYARNSIPSSNLSDRFSGIDAP